MAASFLQAPTDIAANQIGFWAKVRAGDCSAGRFTRVSEASFAMALSGGGLSPAEQEMFDSEYE
ncbi:MAG TPA: hypothetical protein VGC73_05275 [Pyrinomonadaceae bacterium]|jgi:hypothetical protein